MVSVIVPVYKVENYLDECVKSIVNQTYKDIEIILVDDGSPDNCPDMCEEYAKQDSRIRVIHKENGGLSSARNAGIEVAHGDYLCFIDSDDYIVHDMIEQLMILINENSADIASCRFSSDENGLDDGITHTCKNLSRDEAMKEILCDGDMTTSASMKIYKANLFENVRFPVGMIYEDYATIYKVIHNASKISCIRARKYYYRLDNNGSITHGSFSPKQMDFYKASQEVREFVSEKYPQYEKLVVYRQTKISISFYKTISATQFKNDDVQEKIVSKIRKNIFGYMFSRYSVLTKAYGVLICISPKLALKVFKR